MAIIRPSRKKKSVQWYNNNVFRTVAAITVGLIIAVWLGNLTASDPVVDQFSAKTSNNKKQNLESIHDVVARLMKKQHEEGGKAELQKSLLFVEVGDFTESEAKWIIDESDSLELISKLADHYYTLKDFEQAEKLFLYVTNTFSAAEINADKMNRNVIYDRLASIYHDAGRDDEAVFWYKNAIKYRTDNIYANRWYGRCSEVLIRSQRFDEAQKLTNECINDFKNDILFPYHCYHNAAMVQLFAGNFSDAERLFLKLYEGVTRRWRSHDGSLSPATVVPLALDSITSLQRKASGCLENKKISVSVDESYSKIKCSQQEWPFVVDLEEGTVVGQTERVAHEFSRMECYDDTRKNAVLYKFKNAYVQGDHQIISTEQPRSEPLATEEGETKIKCHVYVPGYPYVNSNSQPRFDGNLLMFFDLPIKHYESAIVLHFLDLNYYHFTVESLTKIMIFTQVLQLHESKGAKILLHPSLFARDFLNITGLLPYAEPYSPKEYRYHFDNLYYIDWVFTDEEITNFRLKHKRSHHPEEFYVPPQSALHLTRSVVHASLKDYLDPLPRDIVLFLHRKDGDRRILDPLDLYKGLAHVANVHGLLFRLQGYQPETVEEQIELFSRAVVVIGVHGAGFSNILFCKPKTAVIEIATTPEKVSVYSRLSSALDFPYYNVPSASFYHYASVEYYTPQHRVQMESTLFQALAHLGYSYL